MLLNAEDLPIEYIDHIQVSLSQILNPVIDFDKWRYDPKNYVKLQYHNYFGLWWYFDMQAQRIKPMNIRENIVDFLYQLCEQGVIRYNPDKLILDKHLETFVYEVRVVEFYFDFKPDALEEITPNAFLRYAGTWYSPDRRRYVGRHSRTSLIILYDRVSYLKHVNRIAHHKIDSNPYSTRLEFRLTKQNCRYRTLPSLEGSYDEVMTRYIPYLAVLYNRFLRGNVRIDPKDHPYFAMILEEAAKGRTRYTGSLEKRAIHTVDKQFVLHDLYAHRFMTPSKESTEDLITKALKA